ncbi:TonB-dependent receptor [Siphonobacter sp. SORGH_AS_0500]|uniref:TonB-dependent receptor n=1 Tax=Siphonobacter sp. SORGH_AS_0500 TaxID=1864824 RepID=UPI00286386CC|nr:TonB-dependent receptor [Siphonobacter sp. SORGH_AS_0500]MDR6195026.1 iron complex outermembrane receptor protein [Siphonobacter sp. SORGH_AS_0500]
MKNLFLLFCFLISGSLLAQNSLSGKIIHKEDNETVVGATIYIPDLRIGASSDVNGAYRISNLPKGTFTVQVSYVSHRTVIEKVTIDGATTKDFTMENAAQSLEEVIVSGSSTKTVIKESPIPIAAITQLRLLQQSSTNLIDAVAKLPGMSQVSTGAGLSKPIIRGLGFNRVITMHDGVRQEDNQWGEEHSIQIDEYSIDRYEIIRGAGSLMYGSDGLGGVMSVLSPRPVEEGKMVGRVLSNYQTNNNLYGISAQLAGNKNGFVWLAQASTKSTKNYRNAYDGRVFASNFTEPINFNGYFGLNKKWGYSRIHFLRTYQKYNIINGTRDASGRFTTASLDNSGEVVDRPVTDAELNSRDFIPYNSQRLINEKVSWNNLLNFSNGSSLSGVFSVARNRRSEYGDVTRPWESQLDLYLYTNYYDVRYNFAAKNNWEVNVGTNGMFQRLDNQGFQVLYPNYNLFDNGVFMFAKKSYERLKISGGIRYDIRLLDIGKLYIDPDGNFQVTPQGSGSERFAGFDKNYQNVSASIGGVYNLTDKLAVRINGSRGFRAPTVPELSSNGIHAGTFRYEIGKLDAVPEVAYQGDLGLTYEDKNWYVDLSVFQNSIKNYTYSERVQGANGQDTLYNGNVPIYRYAQGNARLRGVEGTVTFNPQAARWFSITQSYSAVFGDNLSAQETAARYLPFMPAPRWISQVKLTKDRYKDFLRNLYLTVDLEVTQKQNRFLEAYGTETATPGYQLVNIGLGTDLVSKNKRTLASFYFSANNVFDVAYQSHQSRLKYLDVNQRTGRVGVFNMGRNLSFKLVIPFEVKL